jgi:hypothetical protein
LQTFITTPAAGRVGCEADIHTGLLNGDSPVENRCRPASRAALIALPKKAATL